VKVEEKEQKKRKEKRNKKNKKKQKKTSVSGSFSRMRSPSEYLQRGSRHDSISN